MGKSFARETLDQVREKLAMTNDNDLIRRGSALTCCYDLASWELIAAIPAVAASQTADPVINVDSCQRVVVKPFVWGDDDEDGSWADTPHGWCEVFLTDLGFIATYCGIEIGHYTTLEIAKAAAQADYEVRILAALDVQPDPRDAQIAALVDAMHTISGDIQIDADGEEELSNASYTARAALAAVKGENK